MERAFITALGLLLLHGCQANPYEDMVGTADGHAYLAAWDQWWCENAVGCEDYSSFNDVEDCVQDQNSAWTRPDEFCVDSEEAYDCIELMNEYTWNDCINSLPDCSWDLLSVACS